MPPCIQCRHAIVKHGACSHCHADAHAKGLRLCTAFAHPGDRFMKPELMAGGSGATRCLECRRGQRKKHDEMVAERIVKGGLLAEQERRRARRAAREEALAFASADAEDVAIFEHKRLVIGLMLSRDWNPTVVRTPAPELPARAPTLLRD